MRYMSWWNVNEGQLIAVCTDEGFAERWDSLHDAEDFDNDPPTEISAAQYRQMLHDDATLVDATDEWNVYAID